MSATYAPSNPIGPDIENHRGFPLKLKALFYQKYCQKKIAMKTKLLSDSFKIL